jgi:anti-anti-sigma regulatory factor
MNPELDSRVTVTGERQSQLALHGTIDVFLAGELLEHARRAFAAAGDVRIDCAALERLDTSALQILLALQRELEEHGRRLELRAVSDQVGAFFVLGGAERLLPQAEPEPLANAAAEEIEPAEQTSSRVRNSVPSCCASETEDPRDASASEPIVADVPAAAGMDEGWSDDAPAEPRSRDAIEASALGPGEDE